MITKRNVITLIIATRNAHKVGEIKAVLGAGFEYLTLADFMGSPKVVEDAGTFAGNATKKAVELAGWISEAKLTRSENHALLVLADDSGLEVDALNGAPGVHSARFAALDGSKVENSSDAENNAKLLRLLKEIPDHKRTARFRCVLALVPVPAGGKSAASPVCCANEAEIQAEIFEGTCEGRILSSPRGNSGFGYDPLFVPDGYEQTYAELGEQTKNTISHRARALHQLAGLLDGFK